MNTWCGCRGGLHGQQNWGLGKGNEPDAPLGIFHIVLYVLPKAVIKPTGNEYSSLVH
jgi:hypothetical protein